MSAALILIVEDEPTIAGAISRRLAAEGYRIQTVGDGLDAVSAAASLLPDLVLLDVMLPGIDGLEVCRRVQADRPVPVMMLTARDDETDKLIGLGVGADDYMTKPFSMRELVARIKALLRRVERAKELGTPTADDPAIVTGDLVIDRASRRVTRSGQEVHLTPTEFDLLVFLAESPHAVLTREKLLEHVWDWSETSVTRTVDSHIKAIRRKLGADLIRTVHGVGYAFEPLREDEPGE
ncbi:MAG: response regulator transcription factor [Bifidobacteriaceae bacterium]|jgi:DNA-binding response OmpR family regulator|nr:response regulator transcription factor [Bifidobacteriaceae bacterium]